MRNALAHAGKSERRVVSAFIATAFAQDGAEAARAQWRRVADQLHPKLPRLASFLDEVEVDVLAYLSFPPAHRTKTQSTTPIERLNGEINPPRRRHPARTERRMGAAARPLHDVGNHRADRR